MLTEAVVWSDGVDICLGAIELKMESQYTDKAGISKSDDLRGSLMVVNRNVFWGGNKGTPKDSQAQLPCSDTKAEKNSEG